MRLASTLLCLLSTLPLLPADPPQIHSLSPDHAWILNARWTHAAPSQQGYTWDLQNSATGHLYFHHPVAKEEALPQRLSIIWSPSSHHAALNFYYGRALQGTVVIVLAARHPELMDPTIVSGLPLEKTLIKAEDLPSYTDYNWLLSSSDHWLNDTDLSLQFDLRAHLQDPKTAEKSILTTTWHKTVRFHGNSFAVIATACDAYEIVPAP